MEEGRLILIDGGSSKKIEANFLNNTAFFTLWFELIKLCLP